MTSAWKPATSSSFFGVTWIPTASSMVRTAIDHSMRDGWLLASNRTLPSQPAAFASLTKRFAVSGSGLGPATPGVQGKLFWKRSVLGRPLPCCVRSLIVSGLIAATMA
jgi:hypothetical protein